jgi:hypothetical protein
MKTENLEGTESTENLNKMSSGAIGGEISENKALTQKRTTNIAQAGAIGVAKGASNN